MARWKTKSGVSDLSVALDEIWTLRARLAYEAGVIEAHLDYKTFPKSRRDIAAEQIKRMREAARGDTTPTMSHTQAVSALRSAGCETPTLTNAMWAKQRDLIDDDSDSKAPGQVVN